MLSDGGDLGVGGGLVAEHRCQTNLASVPLQCAEHDGVGHAIDIAGGFGVGEGLVSDDLLEAVEVGHVRGTGGGSGVTQQSEDPILDLQRVVELQVRAGGAEDGLVRVFLGNLSLRILVVEGDLTGSSQPGEGENSDLELHLAEEKGKR